MLTIKSKKNKKSVEYDLKLFCYESKFIYDLFLLDNKSDEEIELFYNQNQLIELDKNYNLLLLLKEYFNNYILNIDNFLNNLSNQELFDITHMSDYFCMDILLDKSCKLMANRITQCKTESELIKYFDLKNNLTDEEIDEIKNN